MATYTEKQISAVKKTKTLGCDCNFHPPLLTYGNKIKENRLEKI